jgi:hypothetical protein
MLVQNYKKTGNSSILRGEFGFMEQSMNGLYLRSVGIVRATGIIGLIHPVGCEIIQTG